MNPQFILRELKVRASASHHKVHSDNRAGKLLVSSHCGRHEYDASHNALSTFQLDGGVAKGPSLAANAWYKSRPDKDAHDLVLPDRR